MKTIEQAVLDKILYIGEEIPESLMNDPRPKFIVLGTPQELIDETAEQNKHTPEQQSDCQLSHYGPCTAQCTPEQPNEVERILSEFKRLYGENAPAREPHSYDYLRQILTPLIEDRDAKAREVVEEMLEVSDTIIGKIKSIENPPEAQSAIIHNKGFVYGVESLVANIKAIALSHNIDLPE